MLAESHELVWQAIIAGIVTIVLAWMQQRTKVSVEKSANATTSAASEATVKADQVRQTLKSTTANTVDKLDEVKQALIASTSDSQIAIAKVIETTKATHHTVNGAMTAQLRLYAQKCRRIAEMTKEIVDIHEAEAAEKRLADHEAQNTEVNL